MIDRILATGDCARKDSTNQDNRDLEAQLSPSIQGKPGQWVFYQSGRALVWALPRARSGYYYLSVRRWCRLSHLFFQAQERGLFTSLSTFAMLWLMYHLPTVAQTAHILADFHFPPNKVAFATNEVDVGDIDGPGWKVDQEGNAASKDGGVWPATGLSE